MSLNTQCLAHGTLSVRARTATEQERILPRPGGSDWSLVFWFGFGFEWRFIEHTVYLVDMAVTVK